MKAYDRDKTYNIEFKSEKAKEAMWIHMHCLLVFGGCFGEPVEYKKKCKTVYQLMNLYEDAGKSGQAYGGFLNLIGRLDEYPLKCLKITEKKG